MNNSEHGVPVCIAYIGGGSLNWAPKLMADLAQDTRLRAEVRLYDINAEAAARNAKMGERFAAVSEGTPTKYVVAGSLQEALTGADIVVVSILPGQFSDMAQDIEIPASYGISQAVGDTVGPGGFVRALRAIPMLTEIGRAIEAFTPHAFVCNLTNPMSVLTGALYRAFPEIKCWGECHEVTKLRKQVAWIANQREGRTRWSHRDVQVNVLGINHFTFVDQIALNGDDMLPAYQDFAKRHINSGWVETEPHPDDEHEWYFGDRSRVKFDLMRRYGIPAAAGDRHLAEFVPHNVYLADPAGWSFGLTPVDYRVRYQEQKRENAADLVSGKKPPQPARSDEALVDQIAAVMGLGTYISNVNLPNKGQMIGLPENAIVETNAVFSGMGITPMVAGKLPEELHKIVADHVGRQTALLDAVTSSDFDVLFDLFRSDPLVAPLDDSRARALYRDMVTATAAHLPKELVEEAA
ncbi:family 4 glycosyl hydrolase [Loktanella sp. S4079]|uniref:family 4 glycosyl hydrolase n=1 Tax=Loktanella sp. S4079 TaxID=579483 RepID=UPI0005FA39EE|nr:alpha-galactosidase [Loktanella sp. S4079]KJZ21225.1 alpha-galactosidase [Loktanella sp. S4079]